MPLPQPPPSLTNTDLIDVKHQQKEASLKDTFEDDSIDMTVVSGHMDFDKEKSRINQKNSCSEIANIEVHVDSKESITVEKNDNEKEITAEEVIKGRDENLNMMEF